ncbi:MAG TPA: Rieske 2Fe-2S domain-containing protein [Cyclobacteriaceae bacterium]|nr:Rieske 2Fe-2S domain-containing protein [Cyclobacteriaceae bacterium]HMV07742.1 Rieske 2Fe-2S domain-containing protein [Cyclobacteriaceae bacterium]HMV88010.1 Rieske 2Fe-2S domain-containing protein [Cyclobacteriaceae bacterium]HMW98877.1 Rieske 2Fe-2S domain-containing protein [Cyclobacteriaceae bacterium]HMX48490.1 Rieske 2Fe-2S domain-containing protein [Cyclobacteriaceae bacterium]
MEWLKVFSGEQEALQRIQNNKPQLVIANGQRICLVNHNNRFFAVQDSCTHSGASLSQGSINYLGEIICPLHNYCFNLQTGQELSSRSRDLKTYPVKIDDSGFFIGI